MNLFCKHEWKYFSNNISRLEKHEVLVDIPYDDGFKMYYIASDHVDHYFHYGERNIDYLCPSDKHEKDFVKWKNSYTSMKSNE